MELLLDHLFTNDVIEDDSADQHHRRSAMYEPLEEIQVDETPFTVEEVAQVIKKMKSGKAPGWDDIEVDVLKRSYMVLKRQFLSLFNGCLKFGIFPNEWKKAIVVTLLKARDKDKSIPSSYRPICLLHVLGKVLEGLILGRISAASEEKLSEYQYGFRRGCSTEDAIRRLQECIAGSTEN